MLSASRYLLALIAVASVGPVLWQDGRALAAAGGPDPVLLVKGLLGLAPGLLAIALAGRVTLSFLPPGEPGTHRGRGLVTTWATSHFLGTALLGLQLELFGRIGLGGSPLVVLTPWVLALFARLGTLPGAPRPRRDPATEGPRLASTFVLAITLAAVLLPLVLWASPLVTRDAARPNDALSSLVRNLAPGRLARTIAPLSLVTWPCLLVLVTHGLSSARRAPLGRRVLVLLPALLPFAIAATRREVSLAELPLFFGAGCAFLVPWLRRADRRAACLAAIGFAACGLVSPSGLLLGILGLAAVWLATPVASKLLISTAGAIAVGAVALPGVLTGDLFTFGQRVVWDLASSLTRSPHKTGYWTLRELLSGGKDPERWGFAWALVGLVVVGFLVARALRRDTLSNVGARHVDPPGRELWTLLAVGALGFLAHIVFAAWVVSTAEAPWISSDDPNGALFTLLPAALLIVGLVLVRPEDPKRGRRRSAG